MEQFSNAQERLSQIAALEDQKDKMDKYREFLQKGFDAQSVDALRQFLIHVTNETIPLPTSRPLLTSFASSLSSLPFEKHSALSERALELLQPRAVSFEEQTTLIRESWATILEAEEEWLQAAQVLTGIPFEGGVRAWPQDYKLQKYVKIAQLYLEGDDSVSAEAYINRASALMSSAEDHGIQIHYKACYARILDSKRKFIEAAGKFYELSQLSIKRYGSYEVKEEELVQALSFAVSCAILAPAGPQRSRMLAILYKDERTRNLPVFDILESLYMERLLRREKVDAFASTLQPHQLAITSDGSTVLDKAIVEHNIMAASKLYSNITFNELGRILGTTAEKAELTACKMIYEDRMKGSINQVKGILEFEIKEKNEMLQWDEQIAQICRALDLASEAISLKYPNLIEANK